MRALSSIVNQITDKRKGEVEYTEALVIESFRESLAFFLVDAGLLNAASHSAITQFDEFMQEEWRKRMPHGSVKELADLQSGVALQVGLDGDSQLSSPPSDIIKDNDPCEHWFSLVYQSIADNGDCTEVYRCDKCGERVVCPRVVNEATSNKE